jgi:hypothetical protein
MPDVNLKQRMTRANARLLLLAAALTALLLTACSGPTGGSPFGAPQVSGEPGRSGATAAVPPTFSVTVTDAKYGLLSVRTAPGASCNAYLQISGGYYGDIPPGPLPAQSAGSDGLISWTYPTPRIPAGTGTYTASCQSSAASDTKTGAFTIPTHPIVATSLTVRVTTDAPPGEQFNPDPSLVPLRDASLAKIKATLATEWKSATRGLGSLQLDDRSADITMFVIAARGTSVHRLWSGDDSQDILIYVSGELGPGTVENNVAVALHELGHIWCCHGPDANDGGHWVTKQPSPGLYGVDKYGLMTDPVTCVTFGSILSCPNRFSDREMVALGFTNFPPPAVDPCIQQGLALRSQIGTARGTLTSLDAQIRAIEAQYPGGAPPAVYSSYVSLITQYNALNDQTNAKVRQLSALPCDSS